MSRSDERLAAELERCGLSQKKLSDRAQVAQSTSSGILKKGHVPQCDTLFHRGGELAASIEDLSRQDYLIDRLVPEFRKIPDDWKERPAPRSSSSPASPAPHPSATSPKLAGPPRDAKTPRSQTMTNPPTSSSRQRTHALPHHPQPRCIGRRMSG